MDQAEADMVLIQADMEEKTKKDKTIPVVEIFGPTIQGEGLVAGQRTIFIRFGLCDYKCRLCDSMHAVDPIQVKKNARWLTQAQIAEEVLQLLVASNCGNVTYSGGNPCIHDLGGLTTALTTAGVRIAIETQGTKMPDWVFAVDWITVSPKAPGMGEKFERDKYDTWLSNFSRDPHFCTKVVIFSAQDLEFASTIAELSPILLREDRFYLSVGNPYPPGLSVFDYETEHADDLRRIIQENTEHILEDLKGFPALRNARILPQVHTLLWGQAKGR